MKKQKLKNLLKLGILTFSLSIILTNCEKNEEIVIEENLELSEDHTVNKMSLRDLIKSNAFGTFEKNISERKKNSLASKNKTSNNQYEYIGTEVLRSYIDGQTTYTVAIKSKNDKDENYDLNLLIRENSFGTSTFIVKYSKLDKSVTIHPVNTSQTNTASKSTASKSSTVCRTYSWEVTTPCSCMGHTSGYCTCGINTPGTHYSSSSGNTRVCWETPIEVTTLPGGGSGGGSSGSGFGDPSGIPSTDDNYTPIYIYEGEEECNTDGTCTPPLYWAQAEASGGNPSATELLEILNYFSFDSEPLTNAQKEWINNPVNSIEVDKLLIFLNQNNDSTETKEFAKEAIEALLNGEYVNFGEAYIETNTPDGNYIYSGTTQLISNPIILSNGNQISITFGVTGSDNQNSNKLVSVDLVDGIKFALEQANNNLSLSNKIKSIHIAATTNGQHSPTSNHTNGTAIDISRINGEKMAITGITDQIIELQKALDNFQYVRENFGPHFKHKYYKNTNTWNYNYPVGGHRDHIHFSVRR
tara:strand:+ start:98 stop:1681 length:1584 start_codon:yes stop_codon:yes gene_type:complete